MTEQTAVDTNVLAYAEGVNGPEQQSAALRALAELAPGTAVLPVQVLGELFNVLTRKAKWPVAEARQAAIRWSKACLVVETTLPVLSAALDLAHDHQVGMWDAVILSAAHHSGCRTLLSEDMQHGFTWRGVTVRNPFLHP